MSLLANLTADETIEESGDVIGGGNYGPLESGLYTCAIKLAYLTESTGGAACLNLHLDTDNGREVRQAIYLSSGRAKGQKNTYETKDGKRKYLPGYELAMHLGLLTCGATPDAWEVDNKVVNLWNREAKKEVPTNVDVVTSLTGQPVKAGIMKVIEDKNVQDDSGAYVPSGETRELNEVSKFFRAADNMTVTEIRSQELTEGAFMATWGEKHTGTVRDKSTKTSNGPTGSNVTSGAFGKAAASAPKPKESLFTS